MQLTDILNFYANPHLILARLKENCVRTGEPDDEHWIYKYPHKGDGQFFLNHKEVAPLPRQVHIPKGKNVSARKLSYLLFYKELPDRTKIKTVCGVRACMNPKHLSVRGRERYEEEIIRGTFIMREPSETPASGIECESPSPVKKEIKAVEEAVFEFEAKPVIHKRRGSISVTSSEYEEYREENPSGFSVQNK